MSKTPKPMVYIASPYTKGDPAINAHFQCRIFDELMDAGLVWPVVPLWSHFQHLMFPRPYEAWIDYDLALLDRCDALLRLDAEHIVADLNYRQSESSGSDAEVEAAKALGLPVFYHAAGMHCWARERWATAAEDKDYANDLLRESRLFLLSGNPEIDSLDERSALLNKIEERLGKL